MRCRIFATPAVFCLVLVFSICYNDRGICRIFGDGLCAFPNAATNAPKRVLYRRWRLYPSAARNRPKPPNTREQRRESVWLSQSKEITAARTVAWRDSGMRRCGWRCLIHTRRIIKKAPWRSPPLVSGLIFD